MDIANIDNLEDRFFSFLAHKLLINTVFHHCTSR